MSQQHPGMPVGGSSAPARLGIAGWLTAAFIRSPLTPLMLVASFAFGVLALVTLPREEEPQISVPMVDIMSAPTACARRTR